MAKHNYVAYVKSASASSFFIRPKEHLSVDFWGGVNVVPKKELSGLQNIALLNDGQTTSAINQYDTWTNLTTLWVVRFLSFFVIP